MTSSNGLAAVDMICAKWEAQQMLQELDFGILRIHFDELLSPSPPQVPFQPVTSTIQICQVGHNRIGYNERDNNRVFHVLKKVMEGVD